MTADDAELREELRAVVRRNDPSPETLREVADDLYELAEKFEAVAEAI